MPKAYSYVRFSTPEQSKGDSLRRQKEASDRYALDNGLELDTQLDLNDRGISAYDQSNITKGALGKFLKLVESKEIDKGSYLLVENLDRISRANVMVALPIFIEILNAGIIIVTLADGFKYSRDSVTENPMQLFGSLMIMTRANEESVIKSKRIRASWNQKYKNIDAKRLTARCPYWLRPTMDDIGFEFIPEKVEVVRNILAMAKEGMGNGTIVQRLNDKKIPPFSTRTDGWRPSYIQKLLKGSAVYGDFTASGKLEEPVVGYFPAVISKSEWLLIDSIRKSRITKGGANKGNQLSNLFSGLLICGHCQGPMNMGGYVKKKPSGTRVSKYVACSRARRGMGCKFITWEYNDLENEIIRFCKSVNFGDVLGRTTVLNERASDAIKASLSLKDKIKVNEQKLVKLLEIIESGDEVPKTILDRIRSLEDDISDMQIQDKVMTDNAQKLSSEAVEQSHQQEAIVEILDKLKTLQGVDLHDLRIALSSKIKRVIDRIALYPAGTWMTEEKRTTLAEQMIASGDDPERINNYFEQFNQVRKDERYLTIIFKNGESLRLTKQDAIPNLEEMLVEFDGDEVKYVPMSRENYLTRP